MVRFLPKLRPLFLIRNLLGEAPRVNQVGIQYLSNNLHKKVFPTTDPKDYLTSAHPHLLTLAEAHLKMSGLLGKKTNISDPIDIPHFPDLVGKSTLDEHFTRIGNRCAQPYLLMAESFLSEKTNEVPKPSEWVLSSGWTRYAPGCAPEPVPYPLEDELVFDVEVMYKRSHHALMCTAMSSLAWYGWVSPVLTNFDEQGEPKSSDDWNHLIPFNTHARAKLLVGYNVSYDRARVLEEYLVKQSKAYFLDAMALHIALSGLCTQQRPTWYKHRKHKQEAEEAEEAEAETTAVRDMTAHDVAQELMDDPWLNKGLVNSLASVAEFHCGIHMDKDPRDIFSSENVADVASNFQQLMHYCASDVAATFHVARKLFPEFRRRNAHPVSFAALRSLGQLFLPTSREWDTYIRSAESVYEGNRQKVSLILQDRVRELVAYLDDSNTNEDIQSSQSSSATAPAFEEDPWLRQLNWTIKQPRFRKDGTPVSRQAYLTGYPEWYRDLFRTSGGRGMNVTVRTRITPLLLRLKWEGNPLIWTESAGWCFKVPMQEEEIQRMTAKNYTTANLSEEDFEMLLPELRDNGMYELFKVPHPEGPKRRCTHILSKSYMQYFDSGVLTSEYDYAKEILDLNAQASYWMGNRARITDQFVVYCDAAGEKNKFFDTKKDCKANENMGIILPKLCTMGTVTRRATENTWLTASNSKKNRIGSELKAMIRAPKGYVFVGADVDSEELWIASLVGDSMFEIHGGTALGWMTLEGDKNEKTDLHSKTAEIMGILRNDAKVFNYGRIYGAGVKFATRLLKQCNGNLTEDQAAETANKLYELTKGYTSQSRIFNRRIYHGGTESVMFNSLETIAYQENPRTPVLGASITDALTQKNLNKNNYLTSRINWTIQSSGVDYLHLLIVSMEYLIEKFKIDARLMITVHDELRYFVKEEHKLLCAMLLQISNVWTRAMFCEQLNIKELPQSCAFFSEVDVDFVLRKEVGMDCVTPSHPTPIAPGESYDIKRLLSVLDPEILESRGNTLQHLKTPKYKPRDPVMQALNSGLSKELSILKLAMQNSTTKAELRSHGSEFHKLQRMQKKATSRPMSFTRPTVLKKPVTTTVKKAPKHRLGEEYNLSKDGDELLRQEIEGKLLLSKPYTFKVDAEGAKLPVKAQAKSGSNRGTFSHAFGPPPGLSGAFNPSKGSRAISTDSNSRGVNSSVKSTKPGRTASRPGTHSISMPVLPARSVVRTQPAKPPAGLVVRSKNIHTTASDDNFKRRSQPGLVDSECGLRRRRR